jgi:hypothetical protein
MEEPMKLITAAILKAAPALYATKKVPTEDKLLVAKFFHPSGRGTWYMAEYDPEQRLAFGFFLPAHQVQRHLIDRHMSIFVDMEKCPRYNLCMLG